MSQTESTTESCIAPSKASLIEEASSSTLEKAQRDVYEFVVIQSENVINIRNVEHDETGHCYTIHFENRLPISCTCPSDRYSESPCKHRIAVLIRSPIMEAMKPLVTDGGAQEARERPQITRHTEPESQGGHTFYRCEGCGREAMRRRDLESKGHYRECNAQGYVEG